MLTHPEVPNMFGDMGPVFWLSTFPNGACDITSLTIATVFADHDLGDWSLVSGFDDDGVGHTWLRLRVGEELTLSIDATVHQFAHTDPWWGEGDSPEAQRFSAGVQEHMYSRLPEHWPRRWEREVAEWTRDQLASGLV